MPAMSPETFALLPIAIPSVGGLVVLLIVALLRDRDLRVPATFTVAFLVLSAFSAAILIAADARQALLSGALLIDAQALAFHLLFAAAATVTALTSIDVLRGAGADHGEYFALLLFAVAGMTMMAASENLLTLFLGLEILSIALYVLAGFTRDRVYAIEGALKYFLLGAFSTGFLLYGIALLYGATGRIDLRGIAASIASRGEAPVDPLMIAGAALILIGLGFKAAIVPFHFWAPDVYQGSLAPVAGFMAAGTKAAAFATLLRVLNVAFDAEPLRGQWVAVLSVLAVVTMMLGNVVALAQQNIKRMLAYSSVANAGYLLVAVVAGAERSAGIVLFYLAAYALMTMGAFAVAALLGRGAEDDQGYQLSAYAGLASRRPAVAAAMAIFMLSLTGIPPTAGFMGKFYIFKAAIDGRLYGLAAAVVLASVIGAVYYIRVIVQMYLREPSPEATPVPFAPSERLAIGAAATATVWLGLFPTALITLAAKL